MVQIDVVIAMHKKKHLAMKHFQKLILLIAIETKTLVISQA